MIDDPTERIWAWEYGGTEEKPFGEWCTHEVGLDGDEIEYIRKDLSDAAIAELVEGLRHLDKQMKSHGFDCDGHMRAAARALIVKYGDK